LAGVIYRPCISEWRESRLAYDREAITGEIVIRKRNAESLLSALTALDILLDPERSCRHFESARPSGQDAPEDLPPPASPSDAASGGAPRAESLRHGQELNALFPRYVQLADVASPYVAYTRYWCERVTFAGGISLYQIPFESGSAA
jgi:hypothetical protein